MAMSDRSRIAFERLRRARLFIDERFDQAIDLEAMARQADLSRFHFVRAFRQEFQKTPHQYLQERRIQRAKQLLASGHFSVTDVCFEVGFESLGSFSTLFRRVVGQPPATFRSRSLIAVPHLRYLGPRVIVPGCFMSVFGFDSRPFEQADAAARAR
jgi:AraC-like DNA-binding protein